MQIVKVEIVVELVTASLSIRKEGLNGKDWIAMVVFTKGPALPRLMPPRYDNYSLARAVTKWKKSTTEH